MKTRSTIKKVCADCFFVKRKGTLYVRCATSSKHKQRQGFLTAEPGAEVTGHVCAPTTAAATMNTPAGFQALNQSLFQTTRGPAQGNWFGSFFGKKPF